MNYKKSLALSLFASAIITAIGGIMLAAACSPVSPLLVPTPNPVKKETIVDKADTKENFSPMVDILFVIANDSSMSSYLTNLAANAQLFTAEIFKNQILDYHIGVINGMMDDQAMGAWGGRLSGTPKFIDRNVPFPAQSLVANMQMGSSANDPVSIFRVTRQALDAPLSTTDNVGFLRPDADLAVMYITDTDPEDSESDPDKLYNFLIGLKSGDRKRVSIFAAFDLDGSCHGEGIPTNIRRLLVLSKGTSYGFRLCDSDFGKKLATVSANIVDNVGRIFYLSRIPDLATISVNYGSITIPNDADLGWAYNPAKNALVFGQHMKLPPNQPPGTKLQVSFTALAI